MGQGLRPTSGSPGSRTLHLLQSLSSTTAASAVIAVVSASLLVCALVTAQRDQILIWFEAVASAITLTMVFVLQHTQTRQEFALQRKLDEILRAMPAADDSLINLESASEDELESTAETFSRDNA